MYYKTSDELLKGMHRVLHFTTGGTFSVRNTRPSYEYRATLHIRIANSPAKSCGHTYKECTLPSGEIFLLSFTMTMSE